MVSLVDNRDERIMRKMLQNCPERDPIMRLLIDSPRLDWKMRADYANKLENRYKSSILEWYDWGGC